LPFVEQKDHSVAYHVGFVSAAFRNIQIPV
jgi:hypothetical protein